MIPKDATVLGITPDTGQLVTVTAVDRMAGTYVVGSSGAGKSGLLLNLALQDIFAERATIVIDPHGDLITKLVERLPRWQLPNTYLLDITDEAYPYGLNLLAHTPFETEAGRSAAVSKVMHVFSALWPEVMSQQHLPTFLEQALLVLFETPGTTLVDLMTFLLDDRYRAERLAVSSVQSDVRQWWQTEYDLLSPAQRKMKVQPLLTRLYSLFAGKTLLRNIVGQRVTTINWRRAIEQKQIIFVRLPTKQLEHEAELLGTIIVSQLTSAIYSFADTPERQRPGVSLYIDEFQHFVSRDIEEIFTEARKYGARLTIAHQYRNKLPPNVRSATLIARTKVVFRPTIEDAPELSHLFPDVSASTQIDPHPCRWLREHAEDYPAPVRSFIETYLQTVTGTRQVAIKQPHTPWWAYLSSGPAKSVRVDSPIPALDALLRTVMVAHNPDVPIPGEAVLGFANCGRGFHSAAANYAWSRHDLVNPNPFFPSHLVKEGCWVRPPEDEGEQLYHFIFHLRATMRYLATHPAGPSAAPSSAEIAKQLVALPAQTAYASTAGGTFLMQTIGMAPAVEDAELQTRLHGIRQRTRATYAHPWQQVAQGAQGAQEQEKEDALAAAAVAITIVDDVVVEAVHTTAAAAPPRWEEVE